MNNKLLWVIPLLFALLFSCKRPPAKSVPPPPAEDSSDRLSVSVRNIEFEYFRSRSRVTYTDASNNHTATVDIRIRRDSLIWLSISKLGIEGARGLITPDSIFVLDRLNNQLQVYDFPSLSKKFNTPITFGFLQAAILGNLPETDAGDHGMKVAKENNFYLLRQEHDSVVTDNFVGQDDLKLKRMVMVEKQTGNSLNLNYENFNALGNFLFPYSSTISLNYQSAEGILRTVVTIQHTKAEISDKDLQFPFVVPPKYERKP
jgi:hypothetical protein